MCDDASRDAKAPSASVVRAWVGLMRAQRVLLGAIERDLKAAALPPLGWYDVLLELARSQDGRLRPFEIEHRTLLTQYNLSRLLDRLERERFVQREPFEEDCRGRWVVITDAGRAMRTRMWSVYAKALQDHIGNRLDDANAEILADLLTRLSRNSC